MKIVLGGVAPDEGGGGSCCTATCYNENREILGSISLGDTCLGLYWDCRDFYPTAESASCSC